MYQSSLRRGQSMLGILFALTLCSANLSATVFQDLESEDAATSKTVCGEGYLESQKAVRLRNETGIESAIIGMAPDQSVVRKGDLVVRLDDSLLQDKLAEQEILVGQAKVQTEQAQAELNLLKLEYESARELAIEQRDVAKLKYKMLLGEQGRLHLEINHARDRLELAKKELEMVELRHRVDQNSGAQDGQTEETSWNTNNINANIRHLAAHLEFLQGPQKTYYSALSKLETRQPNVELELVKARFDVAEQKHLRALLVCRNELDLDLARLKQLKIQIASCEIRAPENGFFVCAHHLYGGQFDELEPIEEGRLVRDFETIALLPDMSQLQVKMTISETLISRVQPDQPASVEFDALTGQVFQGTVIEVGSLPEPTSWRDKTKKYSVVVALNDRPEEIRLGAPAVVEIDTSGAQK